LHVTDLLAGLRDARCSVMKNQKTAQAWNTEYMNYRNKLQNVHLMLNDKNRQEHNPKTTCKFRNRMSPTYLFFELFNRFY